ncbi:MAG: peptidase U32 family protein, partial [Lachnospiraceae bacterium]
MKLELLAPAGSIAGMKAVIAAGADAIYIGGNRFGARAYAENPNEEELVQAIRYAHLRGVRVYLTVNTLLRDEELAELPGWLAPYVQAGLDAVLVQDLGVLRLLRREFPHLTIHASTQMTVTGPEGAMLLRELGVARVVPAREMSLSELSEIHKKSGLEVEAFVHGALCVCFSGQCLFSSLLGGRSGNRGRCAQPCRLPYRFALGFGDKAGSKKTIQMRNIEVSSQESCAAGELLSPKDLCALDILPKMAAAGVVSFKIEGRMKQPAYAAGVVEIYRKYLDLLESGNPYRVNPKDRERLYTLFNRGGFTDGYFTRRNGPEMMAPKGRVLTNAEEKARAELYASMDDKYVFPEDALGICGKAFIFAGQPAKLSVSLTDARGVLANAHFNTTVLGDEVLWAKNAPLQEEKIRNQLLKTGGSGFVFRSLEILTDGKAFLPSKSLNELRRKALAALEEEILGGFPALVAEEGVFKQENVSWEAAAKINQGRCVVSAVCDTLPQATAAFTAG